MTSIPQEQDIGQARRGRLQRCCGSPWTHGSFAVAASVLLWAGFLIEPYLWAFTVLGLSVVAPPFLLAAAVSIGLDRHRGHRRREHAVVACWQAGFLIQFGWHWLVLLRTPLGYC